MVYIIFIFSASSPLNITVISSSDLTPHLKDEDRLGIDSHLLQVETSMYAVFQAALDVFSDAGWKYISVIYSDSPAYQRMKEKFVKSAKQQGICIGAEIGVHSEVGVQTNFLYILLFNRDKNQSILRGCKFVYHSRF